MEIIRLAPGVSADDDTDCIKINETGDGMFSLVASALMLCGDGDNPESIAMVGSDPYPSYEAAEAAGLAWAQEQCVQTVFVETGGEPEAVKPRR